jgi:hypothetical protein
MTTTAFDPMTYYRAPQFDAATGVALGVALLSALPKNAPDDIRRCARKVRAATVVLQKTWTAEPPPRPVDKRLFDNACDNAWSCGHGRLSCYASLPVAIWPKAERAAALVALVFPEGLTFLRLPYAAQWAEQERRLAMIDAMELAPEIDELCGPEFLGEIRRTHTIYGEVLGITSPVDKALAAKVGEPLRELQRVIGQYMRKLAVMAEDSEDSLALALRALAPIDDLRSGALRRSTPQGEPAEEPPTPESPAVTP